MKTVTNVLPYHTGPEDRYSLDFVNPEWSEFTDYLAERSMEQGVSVKAREISVETDDGINTLYAVYSRTVPDMLVNSPTEEEISVILDEQYTEAQLQILEVILDIFAGITETVEAGPGRFQIYKDMDLEKISEVLEYPGWGKKSITVVGGQLLSRFILSHPMPNANHRTALGLLERYLRSHGDRLTVPDTGEQGTWYEWARPYIYNSKRLLTVRRKAHVFRYAREFGIDIVRRKNDIDIDLSEFDLTVDNPLGHFAVEHERRSTDFVETVLAQTDSDRERFKSTDDSGIKAFAQTLRQA